MAFKDYSKTSSANTELGDGTYIGPDMLRNKVRPALQQLAADGAELAERAESLIALHKGDPGGTPQAIGLFTAAATHLGGDGLEIPTGIDVVATAGYGALDVGAALYVYDSSVNSAYVTANPRVSFVTTNGRGFRLSADQDIMPEMCGGTDSTALAAAYSIKGAIRWAATTPPAFNDTTYHSTVQHLTNAATPGAWFTSQFAGHFATEALTAGIKVPSTATQLQTNGLAVYVRSERSQPLGIGGDVAGFFNITSAANNCAAFGINLVLNDSNGNTGQILTNELDFNVSVPGTTVNGLNLVIVSTDNETLTGDRNGILLQGAFHATSKWSNGLVTVDGAIDLYAVFVGAVTSTAGTNRDSQPIGLVSYKSDNTRYIATLRGDSTGALVLRPGAATGAVVFQPPDGSVNWGYFNASGFTIREMASGSVGTPPAGYQTLFIDTADHKLKRKDSGGTVTIIA